MVSLKFSEGGNSGRKPLEINSEKLISDLHIIFDNQIRAALVGNGC